MLAVHADGGGVDGPRSERRASYDRQPAEGAQSHERLARMEGVARGRALKLFVLYGDGHGSTSPYGSVR